jgi:7,8-dihydroneopterin aldolase/epimerase/oxygenase
MKNYRKIFLREYEVLMRIGIHEGEKIAQKVVVNIELYIDPPKKPINDKFENVLDYDFLRTEVEKIAAAGHINLQETLVDRIVDTCLKHKEVSAVRVSSEKTSVYPDCKGVGFEVYKERVI